MYKMLMQIHLPPPQLQTHTPPDTRSIVNTHTRRSQLSGLIRQQRKWTTWLLTTPRMGKSKNANYSSARFFSGKTTINYYMKWTLLRSHGPITELFQESTTFVCTTIQYSTVIHRCMCNNICLLHHGSHIANCDLAYTKWTLQVWPA